MQEVMPPVVSEKYCFLPNETGLKTVEQSLKSEYIRRMVKYLKTLRMSAGLTQEQFGAKLGVSRQTISFIENEQGSLTWSLYLAMVCVFYQYNDSKVLIKNFELFDPKLIEEL